MINEEKLLEALKFYANPDSYNYFKNGIHVQPPVIQDWGKKARSVLGMKHPRQYCTRCAGTGVAYKKNCTDCE